MACSEVCDNHRRSAEAGECTGVIERADRSETMSGGRKMGDRISESIQHCETNVSGFRALICESWHGYPVATLSNRISLLTALGMQCLVMDTANWCSQPPSITIYYKLWCYLHCSVAKYCPSTTCSSPSVIPANISARRTAVDPEPTCMVVDSSGQ